MCMHAGMHVCVHIYVCMYVCVRLHSPTCLLDNGVKFCVDYHLINNCLPAAVFGQDQLRSVRMCIFAFCAYLGCRRGPRMCWSSGIGRYLLEKSLRCFRSLLSTVAWCSLSSPYCERLLVICEEGFVSGSNLYQASPMAAWKVSVE